MKHHVLIGNDETKVIIPWTVLNKYNQRILYRRTEIVKLTHSDTKSYDVRGIFNAVTVSYHCDCLVFILSKLFNSFY